MMKFLVMPSNNNAISHARPFAYSLFLNELGKTRPLQDYNPAEGKKRRVIRECSSIWEQIH